MIKTLAAQVKQYKKDSIMTPVCMVLEVIAETFIPMLMGLMIDKGIQTGNMRNIVMIGLAMLGCSLFGLAAGIGGAVFGAKASTGFAKNLRSAMFDNIQTFSFSNIDKFSTAGMVTRLTTDVTNVQNAYQMILRMCFRSPFSLIFAMIMAFSISAKLSLVYLAAVFFLAICLVFITKGAMKHFSKLFEKYDDLNASVQENVSAIRVVKAYVREDYENKKFTAASGNIYSLGVAAEKIVVLNGPIMQLTIYTCVLLLSWLGAKMIVLSGQTELTTGDLTALLGYCMNILMSLMLLSMIFVMVTMSAASARRISEILDEKADLTDPEDPDTVIPDGSIDFDNVSFAYGGKGREPVLRNVDLHIRSGETIGIIGGTGSSKSSLVSLISRLYDVTEGSVKVGGKDVRSYQLEALRNSVSVVLQKNVLFSGTIYDNLRWGNKDASDEECRNACRLACADEFIDRMPDGYDTYIEQGGTNVSGGQKQRLCIARALMKHPKVLILDDSTSAVDTATDAKIRKTFAEEIPDTTKLIIAQRVSSVMDADRIIVLDDGVVNGFGTHKELLESNEIYREVYNSQTGGSGDFDE